MNASPFLSGPHIAVRGDSHTGPRIECGVTRCDAESRNTHHVIPRYDAVLHVIPRYDAVSRNTGKWTPHRGAG